MCAKQFPPSLPKSRGTKIVRRTLKDGSVKIYRYVGYHAKRQLDGESLLELLRAYERSPEWSALAEATRRTYLIYLRPFAKIGHLAAGAIDRRAIITLRDAIASRRGNGAGTGFIRAASALFGWAVDHDWIVHTPVHRIKRLSGGHLPAWTQDQADNAIAGLPEHLRRAVVLALHTGQRRGDLIALRWSDVTDAAIHLRQQKTGEALTIPLHPTLAAELAGWRLEASALHVLTDRHGRPWHPLHLSEQLPRHLAKLGLPRLGIHGLRKLAAARLADAGCSTHEIAAITGHRTLSMVQLYTRTADQERLAAAAVIRLTEWKTDGKRKRRSTTD